MRNEKQNVGTFHLTVDHGQIAKDKNSELINLIDDYFDWSGIGHPVEMLHFLLSEFMQDSNGYTPSAIRDTVWETGRLITFLTKLYEDRKFMKFHEQKMN